MPPNQLIKLTWPPVRCFRRFRRCLDVCVWVKDNVEIAYKRNQSGRSLFVNFNTFQIGWRGARYRHSQSANDIFIEICETLRHIIVPCIIRNSRIIRNARFGFLCIQFPSLENWTIEQSLGENYLLKYIKCLQSWYLRTEVIRLELR